jgi:hypothetical protein
MNKQQKDTTSRKRAFMEVLSEVLVDLLTEPVAPTADSEAAREKSDSPPQARA